MGNSDHEERWYRLYWLNTLFTFFGAIAGWVALAVVVLAWILK